MADDNRPKGRQRNVTGTGTGGYRRGAGLGTGPNGTQGGYSDRPGTTHSDGSGATRAGGGKLITIFRRRNEHPERRTVKSAFGFHGVQCVDRMGGRQQHNRVAQHERSKRRA